MKKFLSLFLALTMMFTLTFALGTEASATNLISEEITMNTTVREIPEGAVEIQTGLYLYEYVDTVFGNTYTFRELYSAEGYCFWEVNQPENYVDGEVGGELLPLEERIFAQYAGLSIYYTTVEQINADFISVPVQEGYEIVSVGGGNTETA